MAEEKLSKKTGKYFDLWAQDYNKAFEAGGSGQSLMQKWINVIFRRKTFRLRMVHLADILSYIDLKDKDVLDVGCGSGQVTFMIAGRCRSITGFDISENMIQICRDNQKTRGIKGNIQFKVCDCFTESLPRADVVLCIAVIEYYDDLPRFMRRLCDSAKDTLVVCDARRIGWRAWLRKALAVIKGFSVYYHDPEEIKAVACEAGMRCEKDVALHSFRTFVFQRDVQKENHEQLTQ